MKRSSEMVYYASNEGCDEEHEKYFPVTRLDVTEDNTTNDIAIKV